MVQPEPPRPAPVATRSRGRGIWPLGRSKRPERGVDRAIAEFEPRRILQLGIHSLDDTLRMLEFAHPQSQAPAEPLHFMAIDPFESCLAEPHRPTLKEAHQRLRSASTTLRLVPGDPTQVLTRRANLLGRFDFMIVTNRVNLESFQRAWYYVPRLLHTPAVVMVQRPDGEYDRLEPAEVARQALAASAALRAARAA